MGMADERLSDQAQMRYEHPSGLLVIMPQGARALILDTIMDMPPHKEFNKSELAEWSGVSRQSVAEHLDLLNAVGVVEGVSTNRYRLNDESDVTQELFDLNGAVNAAGIEADEGMWGSEE